MKKFLFKVVRREDRTMSSNETICGNTCMFMCPRYGSTQQYSLSYQDR